MYYTKAETRTQISTFLTSVRFLFLTYPLLLLRSGPVPPTWTAAIAPSLFSLLPASTPPVHPPHGCQGDLLKCKLDHIHSVVSSLSESPIVHEREFYDPCSNKWCTLFTPRTAFHFFPSESISHSGSSVYNDHRPQVVLCHWSLVPILLILSARPFSHLLLLG